MMLDMFIASLQGASVMVSSACAASLAPPTTALRHIKVLCDEGLVIRQPDPWDGRRVVLELSEKGRRLVLRWAEEAL